MVSIGPYTESYNYTHMFDMVDLRAPVNSICDNKGTIMDILDGNQEYSMFAYLVRKARLEGIFNDSQANITVFVPRNKDIRNMNRKVLNNLDISTARHIVLFSIMNNKINYQLLKRNPFANYNTKNLSNKLFIENIGGKTILNGDSMIVKNDINATNGMIHIVNNFLIPRYVSVDI